MLNRREFIAVSASPLLVRPIVAIRQTTVPEWSTIAYNVLECKGWSKQTDSERMKRFAPQAVRRVALELSMYDPAIVTFAESPAESVIAEIARLMGMNYVFFPSGQNWPGALLTRWSIIESKNCPVPTGERPKDLFTRHWGTARLRNPAGEDILFHSIHLHPSDDEIRQREVSIIVQTLRASSAPSIVMQGDFNHTPDGSEYSRWREAGLLDVIAHFGNQKPTFRVDNFNRTLDYVFVRGKVEKQILSGRPLAEGNFILNVSDTESIALSDHIPVLARFSSDASAP